MVNKLGFSVKVFDRNYVTHTGDWVFIGLDDNSGYRIDQDGILWINSTRLYDKKTASETMGRCYEVEFKHLAQQNGIEY